MQYPDACLGDALLELKKVFGRGQGYEKWNKSTLEENLKKCQNLGFKVIFADNFHYFEYYPSYGELDRFLQGIPIFEDFDSERDRPMLQKYVQKFSTKKGIQFSRHRLVMVLQKIN